MKKILFAAMLAGLVVGCKPQTATCTINGSLTDTTEMNGKTVYLKNLANEAVLDSTVISDGKFTFKTGIDSLHALKVEVEYITADIVAEAGVIELVLEDGRTYHVSGTPLNDTLGIFNEKMTEGWRKSDAIINAARSDTTLSIDEKYRRISDSYKTADSIRDHYFETNKANAAGVIVSTYFSLSRMSSAEIDSMTNLMIPAAKDFNHIKRNRTIAFNKENVTVGTPFIDFSGVSGNGELSKLSDYVGKGNYVLTDFWASWCGPCRRIVPKIKEIHEKYGKKGLIVLGIDVWDSKEPFDKAVADLGITWPQICLFGNSAEPTTAYGISGVPTLILFGPDGKIAARDIGTEEANEILAKAYGI